MVVNFESLSQELVDEILGFLYDDKATLKACSLTCRSMVPDAQRGLFSAISVAQPSEDEQPAIPSTDDFLAFMKIMPHVTSHTKSLHITYSRPRSRRHNNKLAQALSLFGRLTSFSFGLFKSSLLKRMAESELISSVQNLLLLPTLRYVEFMNVPIGLLPYSTSVKHLLIRFDEIMSGHYQAICFQPPPAGRKPTVLKSLDMDDSGLGIKYAIDRIVECQALDLSRLTRLHIDVEEMDPYGELLPVNNLLRLCGSSLKIFMFSPSRHTNELDEEFLSQHDSQDVVDLGPLKSLRTFAVCLLVEHWEGNSLRNPPDIWTPFPWLLKVLKTTHKVNSIEEIFIKVIHLNSDEHKFLPRGFSGYFPWRKFKSLLAQKFPRLRKVKFFLQAQYMPVLRKILDVENRLAVDLVGTSVLEFIEVYADDEPWDHCSWAELSGSSLICSS
ncbi:hypothetical protein M413DRAFT_449384 [Hebeloma cylindrosporum]|uniref:F-box domain-containing protein n=1 Tax=Hebeloma cylindrosporum TaxID=76867 RepID=A0A0C2XDR0_HEBCY|nr:hypothetical protein M413DRAFT_449384 [Hebeloma cylindrosporum h7]